MRFDIDAVAVRDVRLRDAEDADIFAAAREAGVVVMTKDSDFVELLQLAWSNEQRSPTEQLI